MTVLGAYLYEGEGHDRGDVWVDRPGDIFAFTDYLSLGGFTVEKSQLKLMKSANPQVSQK